MPRLTLLACLSCTAALQPSARAPTALRATPDDATPNDAIGSVEFPSATKLGQASDWLTTPEATPPTGTEWEKEPDAVAVAKDALLRAIQGTERGFKKDKSMAADVRNAIHALADAAKDLTPVPLDGDWTLLWTDAPDITSLESGLPFAPTLGRIGQEISAEEGTVVNVIEWRPAALLTTFRAELAEDSVEQRVVTGFTEASPGDVKLVLKGAGLRPRRVLNQDLELGPYDAVGPLSLPFGEFRVLFNDGLLRVVKTGRDHYSINEKYYR